ncbi:hypothetical protein K461DRAFT_314958 [Myriangium duriaei CBS 260.36]|uniref:Wax synthase domain-containing protein n=1 Tax=Myriangium duriaei CBS 260.36 TaxID=1168546 RepID=A0A9P4IZZ6_9PEZI|nr:hypothetical protein K461DRAFT_314958 [Myriangium duriaei CBS 260.36]
MDTLTLKGSKSNRRSYFGGVISLLILTTLIGLARLCVPWRAHRSWQTKDYWMLVAVILYPIMAVLCILCGRLDYAVNDLLDQPLTADTIATVLDNCIVVTKLVTALTFLHYTVLWSVKFSLLSLYHKLMWAVNKTHRCVWVVTCVSSFLLLVGSVVASVFTCGPNMTARFHPGECMDKAASRDSAIALWIGFACDLVTTVAIMCAPAWVVWNCQITLKKKISILAIMGLAVVCVAVAICRVVEVNQTIRSRNILMINNWTFWSVLESSIGNVKAPTRTMGPSCADADLLRPQTNTVSTDRPPECPSVLTVPSNTHLDDDTVFHRWDWEQEDHSAGSSQIQDLGRTSGRPNAAPPGGRGSTTAPRSLCILYGAGPTLLLCAERIPAVTVFISSLLLYIAHGFGRRSSPGQHRMYPTKIPSLNATRTRSVLSLPPLSERTPFPLYFIPLYYVFMVSSLLPRPTAARSRIVSALIVCYVTYVLTLTSGSFAADYPVYCVLASQVFQHISLMLWTVPEIQCVPKESSVDFNDTWAKLCWATVLVFSPRGVNWSHEVKGISALREKVAPSSRSRYVITRVWNLLYYLAIVAAQQRWRDHMFQDWTAENPTGITEYSWIFQVVVTWAHGMAAFAIIAASYTFIAVLFVGLGFSKPKDFPGYFGEWKNAYTIRRFWGRVWHQGLRHIFSSASDTLLKAMNIAPHTFASRYTQLFTAFILSALLHELAAILCCREDCGELFFFIGQAIIIFAEDHIVDLGRYILGHDSMDARTGLKSGTAMDKPKEPSRYSSPTQSAAQPAWYWRAIGFIWVFAWFSYSLRLYIDKQVRQGFYVSP